MYLLGELGDGVLALEDEVVGPVGVVDAGDGVQNDAAEGAGCGPQEHRLQDLEGVHVPHTGACGRGGILVRDDGK